MDASTPTPYLAAAPAGDSPTLAAALDLAARGYRVFPANRNKRPLPGMHGYKDGTTDAGVVRGWFTTNAPGRQLAVATGGGLLVVDLDRKGGVDGLASLEALEARFDELPETPRVRTPSGGVHLWFSYPPELAPRCSAGALGPGIDIRANGGYVVVPPSVLTSGGQYVWDVDLDDCGPPPAPQWLLDLIRSPDVKSAAGTELGSEAKVEALIAAAKRPGKWHASVRSITAHLVAIGWPSRAITAAYAEKLTLDGYTLAQTEAEMREMIDGAIRKGWEPPPMASDAVVQALVGSHDPAPAPDPGPEPDPGAPKKFTYKPPQNSEADIARTFVRRHRETLRHCEGWGVWLEWRDGCWRRDAKNRVFDLVREVCVAHAATASAKTALILASARTMVASLRIAKADPAVATVPDEWDSDPWALNTPSGVVDLRTGQLWPHDPTLLATKITAVGPSDAPAPAWERFLNETTGGDKGLQRFLQQIAGYCLTGDVSEHALFFVFGPGGNGKSVFLNVIAGLMGDYATSAAMDTFTAAGGDRHPTDLAMLQGARMVSASETEEGRAWAESRIKQMTGGDPISARFMRQDFFTYKPQFKLVIVGNHKPVLRNVDDAARRRFNIIPFVYKPPVPDRQLETKLRTEWPAILGWAIRGCLDWQKSGGLARPPVVIDATNEYFSEQDVIARWIDDCCETGRPTYCDTSADLFKSWTGWAIAAGEKPGTSTRFGNAMAALGFASVKNTPGAHGRRGYVGIQVRRDARPSWQDADGE